MSDTRHRAKPADANAAFLPPVPAAVRRAAAASEKLSERMKAGEDMSRHVQPPDGREMPSMQDVWLPSPPARAPEEGVAPPLVVADTGAPPPQPTNPSPGPAHAPPPADTPPVSDWEQRFKSLEGRFNTQVPELVQRARNAEAQLDMAQRRNADLTRQIQEMQQQARTAPPASAAPVSDADTEQWGADFVAATRRQARAEVAGEIAQLRQQIDQIATRAPASPPPPQTVNDHQTRTNLAISQAFGSDAWHTINSAPGFIAWLQENDVFSGSRRHDLLETAYRNGDAQRVARFFKAYQDEHTAPDPVRTTPADSPTGTVRVNLADLAAPGGNPGGSSADTEPPIITQKDIALHYQRITQGYYRSNPKLQIEVGRRIDQAVAEGRVR